MRPTKLDAVVLVGVLAVVGAFVWAFRAPVSEPDRVAAAVSTPRAGASSAGTDGGSGAAGPAGPAKMGKELLARNKALLAERRAVSGLSLPFHFRIQVFNVLGSNHTGPGDDNAGFAAGATRASWAGDTIRALRSDIIGFAELQSDQYAVLTHSLSGFGFYPGTSLGSRGVPTTVAWRTSRFDLVHADHVSIPFVGQSRPAPIVVLRDRRTNREFYVFNAHNAPRGRQAERNEAVAIEIATIKQLRRSGLPVFFIGDLNEKSTVFCQVTGSTDLMSASGGDHRDGCHPPGQMRIDWIFGSNATFRDFTFYRSAQVARTTDHHVPFADVMVQ